MESDPYEVQELHFREDEEKVAYVKRVNVDYFTDAVSAKGVWILRRLADREHSDWIAEQGEVLVAEKVVGFKKIKMGTLENVGSGEVDLPQQEMQTTSVWLTSSPDALARVSASREELIDGLRGVTHLLHHLAPIFLLCDVRDLGSWLGDTTPAEMGTTADLKVGQTAVAMGSPLALAGGPSVTVGVISALHRTVRTPQGAAPGLSDERFERSTPCPAPTAFRGPLSHSGPDSSSVLNGVRCSRSHRRRW